MVFFCVYAAVKLYKPHSGIYEFPISREKNEYDASASVCGVATIAERACVCLSEADAHDTIQIDRALKYFKAKLGVRFSVRSVFSVLSSTKIQLHYEKFNKVAKRYKQYSLNRSAFCHVRYLRSSCMVSTGSETKRFDAAVFGMSS